MSVVDHPTTTAFAHGSIFDGFDAVTLAAGDLEAVFTPELGMAAVSLRHRGDELLDRRAGLRAYRDTGAVMGLPFLHPWANRLGGDTYELHGRPVRLNGSPLIRRDEHGLPIHGLLAAHPGWTVRSLDAGRACATLRAELDFDDGALLAGFPFPHTVTIEVTLTARELELVTTVAAIGGSPVPIAFGHHPYLRLPGVAREEWELAFPARRRLELDARGLPTGRAQPMAPARLALCDLGFDDAFDSIGAGARFELSGGGRTIAVCHREGYPVAQVFSPPGAPFVCLEPMTAPVDALRSGHDLPRAVPGRPFRAAFSIAVEAM